MNHTSNYSSRSEKLLYSFWDMHKNFMRSVQHTATTNGLSVPQFAVLMTLKPHIKMIQKVIGGHTYLPKSTLSYAIDELYKLQLIDRKQVEGNRRETLIILTPKGKSKIEEMNCQADSVYQLFRESVNSLTEEQFNHLIKSQQHITSYFMNQGSDHK